MDNHLGYEKSKSPDNDDYHNGYKSKQINSRYDHMEDPDSPRSAVHFLTTGRKDVSYPTSYNASLGLRLWKGLFRMEQTSLCVIRKP